MLHMHIFAIMFQKLHARLELTGSFVALACAIHCISIPLIISFGGLGVIQIIDHTFVEVGFLVVTLIIAGWSLFVNYSKNMINAIPIALFLVGFTALFISILFHFHILSAIGGLLIATAHLVNWKQLRAKKS